MMQYLTPKASIKDINEAALRSSSAQAVAEIMFVKIAQEQQLDDTTVAEFPELFVQWDENWRGKAGDIVRDEGQLYRSIHDVTDAGQNRKPSENPSMWTRIGNPLEEFPEWIQPLGAHDAYSKGAKVSHNGKKWTSTLTATCGSLGSTGGRSTSSPQRPVKPPRSPQETRTESRESNFTRRAKRQREGRQKPPLSESKKPALLRGSPRCFWGG